MASTIKKAILAASITLISFNAQATLTSYNSNGIDLVYSSISDVTWTRDGNLLGSMMTSQGFNTVVNDIIAASPNIVNIPNYFDGGTGSYNVSASDFSNSSFGTTTWYGAMAFINYLNTINYAGSDDWRLPTVTVGQGYLYCWNNCNAGYNVSSNGTAIGNEYAELYYKELGSLGYFDIYRDYQPTFGIVDPDNKFENEQHYVYWMGTEDDRSPTSAWYFHTEVGMQDVSVKVSPGWMSYAWAITSGQLSETPPIAVPEPDSLAFLLTGLGLLGVAVGRNKRA